MSLVIEIINLIFLCFVVFVYGVAYGKIRFGRLQSDRDGCANIGKQNKYNDPFGNPIYVHVRVGDKTASIKADDLQKAIDYVTEHGEEVTIDGRSDD